MCMSCHRVFLDVYSSELRKLKDEQERSITPSSPTTKHTSREYVMIQQLVMTIGWQQINAGMDRMAMVSEDAMCCHRM